MVYCYCWIPMCVISFTICVCMIWIICFIPWQVYTWVTVPETRSWLGIPVRFVSNTVCNWLLKCINIFCIIHNDCDRDSQTMQKSRGSEPYCLLHSLYSEHSMTCVCTVTVEETMQKSRVQRSMCQSTVRPVNTINCCTPKSKLCLFWKGCC